MTPKLRTEVLIEGGTRIFTSSRPQSIEQERVTAINHLEMVKIIGYSGDDRSLWETAGAQGEPPISGWFVSPLHIIAIRTTEV